MLRYLGLAACVVLSSTALGAQSKEQDRLENCGVVMQEILDVPDNIPQELLDNVDAEPHRVDVPRSDLDCVGHAAM